MIEHQMMSRERVSVQHQFVTIRSRVDRLVGTMDEAAFSWRPESGGWSVGQCLEHLNVFGAMARPRIDQMIADAERRHIWQAEQIAGRMR